MDSFAVAKECTPTDPTDPAANQGQIYVQLVLSLTLGISAFFGFCVSIHRQIEFADH
jgi:hypothetical protein